MFAAAQGKSTLGIPQSVGQEYVQADTGGKLPKRAKHPARKLRRLEREPGGIE